jgi:hypothetical protein
MRSRRTHMARYTLTCDSTGFCSTDAAADRIRVIRFLRSLPRFTVTYGTVDRQSARERFQGARAHWNA